MKNVIAFFKFSYIISSLIIFIGLFGLLNVFGFNKEISIFSSKVKNIFIERTLKVLGVDIFYRGLSHQNRASVYVGNHLSYIDVLVLQMLCPVTFVTSREIEKTPLLGKICKNAGCLFVDRKSIWNLRSEVISIAEKLMGGESVAIFPEGTTTDGQLMLPFRTSLLQAAKITGAPIVPVAIKYSYIDGERFGAKNKDSVCWYAEMGFAKHLFNLCKRRYIKVEVDFFSSITIGETTSRKDATDYVVECIEKKLCLSTSNSIDDYKKYFGDRMVFPGSLTVNKFNCKQV